MNIHVQQKGNVQDLDCDQLVVGVYESTALEEKFNTFFDGELFEYLSNSFRGSFGERVTIPTFGKMKAKNVVVLGLGPKDIFSYERMKEVTIRVGNTFHKTDTNIGFYIDDVEAITVEKYAQAVAEALPMANYTYNEASTLQELTIFVEEDAVETAQEGIQYGQVMYKAKTRARHLMKTPSNILTPTELKNQMVAMANEHGMDYKILEKKDLEEHGMGGILAVAKGSVEEPYVVTVSYKGAKDSDETVGLIGKGVTFDTGGISLKGKNGMEEMVRDMGGSATLISVMDAIGRLRPKINVRLVVGCVDNMPSGSAYKPGDVYTMMNGKTVEIISTDSEGRLVLGDCMTYALQEGVSSLIDCATLTGGARLALGHVAAGVMGNNQSTINNFLQSVESAGERAWQLPLYDEFREVINSEVATMKNSGGAGGRFGNAMVAGKFLQEFVGDTPWLHLDITTSESVKGEQMPPLASGGMIGSTVHYLLEKSKK